MVLVSAMMSFAARSSTQLLLHTTIPRWKRLSKRLWRRGADRSGTYVTEPTGTSIYLTRKQGRRSEKDKRMCAIEGLEIIEENLKWFVGFIRDYIGSCNAVDAVPFQHDGLDRIARKIERFLADSAELKAKALEAK
jgi:hypothetical protein